MVRSRGSESEKTSTSKYPVSSIQLGLEVVHLIASRCYALVTVCSRRRSFGRITLHRSESLVTVQSQVLMHCKIETIFVFLADVYNIQELLAGILSLLPLNTERSICITRALQFVSVHDDRKKATTTQHQPVSETIGCNSKAYKTNSCSGDIRHLILSKQRVSPSDCGNLASAK